MGGWKKKGQGTYTHKTVTKYIGEYKDDKRHGQDFIYVNGAKEKQRVGK